MTKYNFVILEGKIAMSQLIRINSGNKARHLSVQDALDKGLVEKKREWKLQRNQSFGKHLNYAKDKWVTDESVTFKSYDDMHEFMINSGLHPNEARVLRRTSIVDAKDKSLEYGYTEQKVIKDSQKVDEDENMKMPSNPDQAVAALVSILGSQGFDNAHKLSQIKLIVNKLNIQ